MAKFEFNINKKYSDLRMKKKAYDLKEEKLKPSPRSGYIEIENKYRDLMLNIESLIDSDFIDEIIEEK